SNRARDVYVRSVDGLKLPSIARARRKERPAPPLPPVSTSLLPQQGMQGSVLKPRPPRAWMFSSPAWIASESRRIEPPEPAPLGCPSALLPSSPSTSISPLGALMDLAKTMAIPPPEPPGNPYQ